MKFKVGDRVLHNEKGLGTILQVKGKILPYFVEYDDWNNGHNGHGTSDVKPMKVNSCWWENEKDIKLVEEKVEPKTMTDELLDYDMKKAKDYINEMYKSILLFGTSCTTNHTLHLFNNQPKKSIMQKLSSLPQEIRRMFDKDQKALYQAGYIDSNGKWTETAIREADLEISKKYLNDNMKEFVDRANEIIALEKEEKECC